MKDIEDKRKEEGMKYGVRFLFSIIFIVCAAGQAQTVADNTVDEPEVVTVQKDNQPADEPAPAQNEAPEAPEKSLAKKDKSIYISSNRAPNQTTSAVTEYDFTDSAEKYYGGNLGAKELEEGVWGMVAGDADGDGYITAVDNNNVWQVQNGYTGYLEGDYDLDSYVTAVDANNFWQVNNGIGSQVP